MCVIFPISGLAKPFPLSWLGCWSVAHGDGPSGEAAAIVAVYVTANHLLDYFIPNVRKIHTALPPPTSNRFVVRSLKVQHKVDLFSVSVYGTLFHADYGHGSVASWIEIARRLGYSKTVLTLFNHDPFDLSRCIPYPLAHPMIRCGTVRRSDVRGVQAVLEAARGDLDGEPCPHSRRGRR